MPAHQSGGELAEAGSTTLLERLRVRLETCQDVALYLSGEITKLGPFKLITEGRELPVFVFTLKDTTTNFSLFDLSDSMPVSKSKNKRENDSSQILPG